MVVSFFIGIPVSTVAYFWWVDTFFSKKNPWWVKFVLLGVSIWILISIINALMIQNHSMILWKAPGGTFSIIFSFFILLFPGISYFIALLFDIILNFLLAYKTVFGGIKAIFQPRPVLTVMELASEEIQSTQPDIAPWKLSDLPKTEVTVLRQWAEANREGSEKRTIPAFLIAALIGVFFSNDFLRKILDYFISNLIAILQTKSIFALPLAVSLSTFFVTLFFGFFIIIVLKP